MQESLGTSLQITGIQGRCILEKRKSRVSTTEGLDLKRVSTQNLHASIDSNNSDNCR